MQTNLLQTYMNNNRPTRDLDIKQELSNRTFIKPLEARGKLLKNGVLETPVTIAKHIAYDANSVKKSAKGKSNDHELGKVNDVGMRLGGLAIAVYLASRKQTPLTKVMEFVGLASFFGAMAIWPKLALQLPAKLIHGFNIKQKYEDSFKREKPFYQDPQYLPWDLYSDKKINKIGNYMGVDKNMPNRREFIQEKMKKTAVQNNTLWMLTAGFATPIMSALICNLSEKPINKYLDKKKEEIANAIPKNFPQEAEKHINQKYVEDVAALLNANKDATLTPELVKKIKVAMSEVLDPVTTKSLELDLNNILNIHTKEFSINNEAVEKVIENSKKALAKHFTDEQITTIVPSAEKITSLLEAKNLLNCNVDSNALQKAFAVIGREFKTNAKTLNLDSEAQLFFNAALFNKEINKGPITSALRINPMNKLTEPMINNLREISEVLKTFKAECGALDKYVYLKLAQAPETNLANAWNDVMDSMLKAFKISNEEITATRYDARIMNKLFREKLESISSNDTEYKRVVEILSSKLAQIDERMKGFDMSAASSESYASLVNSTFDKAAENLKTKCPQTARSLVGLFKDDPKQVVEDAGSLKNVYKMYVSNRLTGVRSSLYRIINALDVYRRISTKQFGNVLDAKMPIEVKEELLEMIKCMATEGKIGDFLTKFYVLRNPNPCLELGDVTIQNGKVINKYFNPEEIAQKVDLPHDMTFFQNVMKFIFGEPMHADTQQITNSTILSQKLKEYRQASFEALTNHKYFFKPFHVLSDVDKYTLHNKFLITGMPLDHMAAKAGRNAYNTGKWFKMFGGIGAVLTGVTVLSQFFFGRMKEPERKEA